MLDRDPLGLIARAFKPLKLGSFVHDRADAAVRLTRRNAAHLGLCARRPNRADPRRCTPARNDDAARVEDFKKRVLGDWTGAKPEILVTGRTPYVGEQVFSEKMSLGRGLRR